MKLNTLATSLSAGAILVTSVIVPGGGAHAEASSGGKANQESGNKCWTVVVDWNRSGGEDNIVCFEPCLNVCNKTTVFIPMIGPSWTCKCPNSINDCCDLYLEAGGTDVFALGDCRALCAGGGVCEIVLDGDEFYPSCL